MSGDFGCWRGTAGGLSLSCPCYEKGDTDILVPKSPRASFFPLLLSDSAPLVWGARAVPRRLSSLLYGADVQHACGERGRVHGDACLLQGEPGETLESLTWVGAGDPSDTLRPHH